jgi:hypothetical protein
MQRFVLLLLVIVAVSLCSVPGSAQVSLTEINAANTISQDMEARNARAVTGAADGAVDGSESPAAATESVGMGGTKYIPAYAIVLMLVGLSTFVACRPSRRHAAD